MGQQNWRAPLVVLTDAGTLYNTYTTAKSMFTSATAVSGASAGVVTLPPNYWYKGKAMKITGVAGVSNRVTGPDTFTMEIRGGPTSNIIVFTSGLINLTTTVHTTIPMEFVVLLTCRSVGNGTLATLMGQAIFRGQMVAMAASLADNAAGTGWAMGPNTAPAVGTGFDSTVSTVIDLFVAQSVSNAGNGFQIQQYMVEELN